MNRMKYGPAEAMQEVLRRRERLLAKRQRRATGLLSCAAVLLTALLVASIGSSVNAVPAGESLSAYGAFLLADASGGYVLTAVLAFALGAVAAVLSLGYRRKKLNKQNKNADDKTEEKE